MRITDAEWTRRVNLLHIECECGRKFAHPADRWTVKCPFCRKTAHLGRLRDEYLERNREKQNGTP